ncbi:hypothetical protein ACOMHN_053179 [Nucella lapillus]
MASKLFLRRLLPSVSLSRVFQTSFRSNRGCVRAIHSHLLKGQVVKIGCASGFWGDTTVAAPQLIYGGKVDYIVFDYLSEITMSLLTAAKHKNPEMGYAPDFISISMAPFIKDIKSKGIKVISNAGGVNPSACARALQAVCEKAGVHLNIAVVSGDDLMPQAGALKTQGITDMSSSEAFPDKVHSMNAYLGAGPIVRALDLGADVVITGRCVDSGLVLGPLIHQFGWTMNQHDLLAAGSLAGHLIECGAQATGGIFTDWHRVKDWDNIGFPVVQCGRDGQFVLTKPPKTGGLVSRGTVAEQLLYEIADPALYFLPDVVCDFSRVSLEEVGVDAVFVTGARGNPPSGEYKVSATHLCGYRSTAVAAVGGPRAKEKADMTAEAILRRCRRIFHQLSLEDFKDTRIELLGTEHMYGPHGRSYVRFPPLFLVHVMLGSDGQWLECLMLGSDGQWLECLMLGSDGQWLECLMLGSDGQWLECLMLGSDGQWLECLIHVMWSDDGQWLECLMLGVRRSVARVSDVGGQTDSREIMMWLAVTHNQKKALEFFAREIAPAGTGMAPGLCGIVGGRPRVSPVLKLFSFLYPKNNVEISLEMNNEFVETYSAPSAPTAEYLTQAYPPSSQRGQETEQTLPAGQCSFRLEDLAYTRSGDKGNNANIGVIARHPSYLPHLRQALTAESVETYFAHLFDSPGAGANVERFDVPGVNGMNFVLHRALGGGGIASLRSDPQGKALGQMLLDFEITGVPDLPSLASQS